ncbi:MAG: threonylcarbamoyl-AMP synthase [Bauldia sp.]|nr:threonylcarbamoyl-AMP synthase [Bauldia sp.]
MSNPEAFDAGIAAATTALRQGALVGMPTETVYGLAADATSGDAVAAIYAAKTRPRFNPLIVHLPSAGAAERLAVFSPEARALAEAFWPGPLTLVLPKRSSATVAELATAGLDTVAIRVPAHPVARALLATFGRPVAAPSANRSGHVSPTTAAHVAADLGARVAVILDAGPTGIGVESTIVGMTGDTPRLLRAGGLARADIEAVIGGPLAAPEEHDGAPVAPGMLRSHYAPAARLRLDVAEVRPGEALIAFGPALPAGAEKAARIINLSEKGDPAQAAAGLFAALRELDAEADTIAVAPVPETGLGEAINDRLRRAAAPRG